MKGNKEKVIYMTWNKVVSHLVKYMEQMKENHIHWECELLFKISMHLNVHSYYKQTSNSLMSFKERSSKHSWLNSYSAIINFTYCFVHFAWRVYLYFDNSIYILSWNKLNIIVNFVNFTNGHEWFCKFHQKKTKWICFITTDCVPYSIINWATQKNHNESHKA